MTNYEFTLRSARSEARVIRFGAQLLVATWDGQSLLWASVHPEQPDKPRRAGVPICFPWFGSHPAGYPSHGFARIRDWDVLEIGADFAEFRLCEDETTLQWWPHRFEARMRIAVGNTIQFAFSVENTGTSEFAFSYALHSYFAVSNPEACTVDGLQGRKRREFGNDPISQVGNVEFQKPIDAKFDQVGDVLHLHDGPRVITIQSSNMASAVVWNPGEAGESVVDIGSAWRNFVCVERGNIDQAAVRLEPGARHMATMDISADNGDGFAD